MKNNNFALKYNVELFSISLLVNKAKEKGFKSVVVDSPVFKMSYDELNLIAEFLIESNNYKTVMTDFKNRRNSEDPKGRYSEKTITLHWS